MRQSESRDLRIIHAIADAAATAALGIAELILVLLFVAAVAHFVR
jgi:hypothetical protein